MDPSRVAAVAGRVAAQFRRDHRSLGLLIGAPILVLSLVGALWGGANDDVARVAIHPPALAAQLVPRFTSAGIDARAATTLDEAIEDLRAGRIEAVLAGERLPLRIIVEGSDPLRTGGIVAQVQRGMAQPSAPGQTGGVVTEYLYGGPDSTLLDHLAPVLIGFFAFFFIFLLATVSFLRERTSGTLERLLASPLRRSELVAGYLAGFGAFALLQAAVIVGFTTLVLRVQYRGSLVTVFLVAAVVVVLAVSLGLLVSAFARTELQAVQFIPVVVLPQVFLSGLLVPVDDLPEILRPVSAVLPLTYATEALRAVMVKGFALTDPLILRDLGILVAVAALAAAGAMASIRREVA